MMNTSRQIISLNGDWEFAYTKGAPGPSDFSQPLPEQFEISLPVPAYWDDCKGRLKYTKFWSRGCDFNPEARSIEEFPLGTLKPPDASLPYLLGTGWYKRHFKVPSDRADKIVALYIGGAMLDAWIWLNGSFLGTCYSCGQPFEVLLDEVLQDGENELLIAVSNIRDNRKGCSIRGYKGKSGGINRSIELRISQGSRIQDCYINSSHAPEKLSWEVALQKNKPGNELAWRIMDEQDLQEIGSGRCPAEGNLIHFDTKSFGMHFWSDREPVLYHIDLKLFNSEGKELDCISQSYGMRKLERKDTHLLLNGSPVFLRGATDHAYFPETCTVPNDHAYYGKTIRTLKAAGFNWVRFHTTTPPEEFLDVADRLGMLVQTEAQNGFCEEDFIKMILLCRKHPSVILYCCGNEVPVSDEFERKLEKMAEHCHAMAPDCLYDPMEALAKIEFSLDKQAEGYVEVPYPHNAVKLARLRKFSDVFATAVWVFSYEALEPDMDKIHDRLSIYERPCLIHEAGILDTYLNLDLERRYEETRIGTNLFTAVRKHLGEMGVLKNAPLYYQNSCRWMKLILKFALEKARRFETVAGYDLLGAIDCHWHRSGYAVGIMNEFYELKAGFSFEELQKFNGESILLSDAGHERNMYEKERKIVKLWASLYGRGSLERGCLFWSLIDDKQEVRQSGILEVSNIQEGGAAFLGEIGIGLDKVKGNGEHLLLKVDLKGGIYDLTNEWDYWIFPEDASCGNTMEEPGCEVRTVFGLKEEDIVFMERGGRVLLLGKGPFPSLPISFKSSTGGRVIGNSATVIHEHPLMQKFPHDGFCDWQFLPMFRNGEAVVFNDLNIAFKPIIEIVSTYKMVRKQAAIFELGIGKGGMLACTMNVRTTDAGAKTLYNLMRQYLSSSSFLPTDKVGRAYLSALLKKNRVLDADFTTDECFDSGGQTGV